MRQCKSKTEFGGLLAQSSDVAFALFVLKTFCAEFSILNMVFQQIVNGSGNFVSGGYLGKLWTTLCTFTAIISAKGARSAGYARSSLAKSLTGAIVSRQGSTVQHAPAGNIVVRR